MANEAEQFCKCPYLTVQRILSGKWSLLILCFLRNGALRFSELEKYLPDLTQSTLTKHLRKLESDGLVVRTVYPQVPPRVEYALSGIGRELCPVLDALGEYGFKYIDHQRKMGKTLDSLCEEARTPQCRCMRIEPDEN